MPYSHDAPRAPEFYDRWKSQIPRAYNSPDAPTPDLPVSLASVPEKKGNQPQDPPGGGDLGVEPPESEGPISDDRPSQTRYERIQAAAASRTSDRLRAAIKERLAALESRNQWGFIPFDELEAVDVLSACISCLHARGHPISASDYQRYQKAFARCQPNSDAHQDTLRQFDLWKQSVIAAMSPSEKARYLKQLAEAEAKWNRLHDTPSEDPQ